MYTIVLRLISLVLPIKCSFDELLCVGPSSSPLPILSTHFGIESSTTFHKLVLSDSELKLSGYISEPHGIFSLKVLYHSVCSLLFNSKKSFLCLMVN